MSKVLKIVGVIVGVAAAVATLGVSLGVSAAILSAVSLGASIGASLLAPKPKAPANSTASSDRLRANIDTRTPRKTWVGITAANTDIRDEEFTDSQTYFHRFIVLASHKAEAVSEVWFDDKLAWSLASGVQGEFAGYLTVTPILEGSAGNAINISARMGATRRYTGLAYLYLRYRLTGVSSSVQSPFAQSITTRITIRGKGAAIYDPRLDSTNGGTGSHRPDDQATWLWNDDACRNPALQLLFYLLGYRINGELAIGKGIPASRIDLPSFAVAANICDESVTKIGGGTEPRYRTDGVWSEGDSPTTVMDMLKASMNADLDDVDGKLRLTIFHNDLATPSATFTDNDVLGEFEWIPAQPLNDTFNIVRGIYTDASDASLYQPVDYPEVTQASEDGIDRIETFDLPMVQSAGQAQRLAAIRLMRNNYGGTFSADYQATAWAIEKNTVVTQTFSSAGFTEKLFRVSEMEIREDGVVPLVLREEHASIYGAPTLVAAITPIAASTYDPALSPIVSGITAVAEQIENVSSSGAVYGTISGSTNTTSLVAVGPEMTFVAGATGVTALAASYSFTSSGVGIREEYAQWYDVTGTPAALGTETLSSQGWEADGPVIGMGDAGYSWTGLTTGSTYKAQLYMRNAAGTAVRNISGSCSAIPS